MARLGETPESSPASGTSWLQAVAGDIRLLDRSSTAERVADVLRRRITDGDLPPRTHLSEEQLIEVLRVSRNTLREAFRLLSHEGLLVHELHRGVFVRELDRGRPGRPLPAPPDRRVQRRPVARGRRARTELRRLYDDVAEAEAAVRAGGLGGGRHRQHAVPPRPRGAGPEPADRRGHRAAARRAAARLPLGGQRRGPARDVRRPQPRAAGAGGGRRARAGGQAISRSTSRTRWPSCSTRCGVAGRDHRLRSGRGPEPATGTACRCRPPVGRRASPRPTWWCCRRSGPSTCCSSASATRSPCRCST